MAGVCRMNSLRSGLSVSPRVVPKPMALKAVSFDRPLGLGVFGAKFAGRNDRSWFLQSKAPIGPAEPLQVPTVQAASESVSIDPSSADPGIQWGADLKKLAACIGLGALVWFAPPPAGVTTEAWHLLAIFLGTIVGIVTTPLPLGAVAMLGLGATMLTKTLTFSAAFSAFATEIP